MSENPYAAPEAVAEEKPQKLGKSAVWRIARMVFYVHLVPVLLTCGLMASSLSNKPKGEEQIVWSLLFNMDLPLSMTLICMGDCLPVGNAVLVAAGVPQHWWLLYDVIWPGVLFQLIGTLNWTAIVLLLRRAWKGWVYFGRE